MSTRDEEAQRRLEEHIKWHEDIAGRTFWVDRYTLEQTGVARFTENTIVSKLYEIAAANGFGMNEIALAVQDGTYQEWERADLCRWMGHSLQFMDDAFGDHLAECDRNLNQKVIGNCLVCGCDVKNVPNCPNNPDDATEIRIGGYWGSTAFDGSDMTGEFLWALLCDRCLRGRRDRCSEPQKDPTWWKASQDASEKAQPPEAGREP